MFFFSALAAMDKCAQKMTIIAKKIGQTIICLAKSSFISSQCQTASAKISLASHPSKSSLLYNR
jgi:hypothetical protein